MSTLKEELGLLPTKENNALYQETLRIARVGKRCLRDIENGNAKELAYNLEKLYAFTIYLEQITQEMQKRLDVIMAKRERDKKERTKSNGFPREVT